MPMPASLQDPAGLLQRIVELQALCSEPSVRRAVATGDTFKVYRALWWARLTGKLGPHRRALDVLLRNRRVFAKPLKGGQLFLGTFNSFGASFVGGAERGADGTHIATHAVVALFKVPLFPLGAYVVRQEGSEGLSTSWSIFARVPLGTVSWLWSRLVAAAAVLAVVAGAASAFYATRHHDLWVVNGLPAAVQVTVGPASATIPPGQRRKVNVPVGTHAAKAVAEGAVVDEGPIEIAAGRDLLVWNVAGAAPVMEQRAVYHREGTTPQESADPPPVFHCGERRLALAAPDYEFQPAPEHLGMPSGTGTMVKRVVDVAQQEGMDGALLCAYLAGDKKDLAGAARILEARARAARWEAEAATRAIFAALQVSKDAEIRVVRAYRDARPEDVDVQRTYQSVLESAGQEAAVRDEYRKRAEAAPDDVKAQYLYARLLPNAEALPAAERLAREFPDDPDVLRFLCGSRFDAGDWKGADAAWKALRAKSAKVAASLLSYEAFALAALGRGAEALALVAEVFPTLEGSDRLEAAVLFARLAQRIGARDPDGLIAKVDPEVAPFLRAQAGLPPAADETDEEDGISMAAVVRAAGSDPQKALEQLATLPALVLVQLDDETRFLLHAEAVRAGNPAARLFDDASHLSAGDLAAFQRFVRGEPGAPAPHLHPAVRAAAALIRSRNASLPAAERAALRTAALRDDVLGTTITRAARAWPAAK